MTKSVPSFSVVLETENLGMAGIEDLRSSLDSLAKQTLKIQSAKDFIIVVGTHVPPAVQAMLKQNYPWVTLYHAQGEISYTKAKYLGAQQSHGDIVVFADSDVRYPVDWLASLLNVFQTHQGVAVATSDTRVKINSGYTLALNLTWMIDVRAKKNNSHKIYSFNLNNFAIRREAFLTHPFPKLDLYRGHIAFWRQILRSDGLTFYRVPTLQCFHAPPSTLIDYLYRMIIYGADFVASGDYLQRGKTVHFSPSIVRRLCNAILWIPMKIKQFILHTYRLISEDPRILIHFPLACLISFFSFLLTCFGAVTAIFFPKYWYRQITTYEANSESST